MSDMWWVLIACVPLFVRATQERTVTKSIVLSPGEVLHTPLVIGADNVTIEGNGAVLQGPGVPGKPETYVGIGIRSHGHSRVTIRNLTVVGFQTGLEASDGREWTIEGCAFSDNYHDPEFGWGEGPRAGGIVLTGISHSRIIGTTASRVWNACDLRDCHDNEISGNVFSPASNTCLKLWHSCRNRVIRNDLSWGLRIKPGEVHARDSAGVLIESGSDDNYFEGNDITHGGDGIFIRVLNGWVSCGNVFVANDCSWANNNCIESWAPGNTFIRNKANHGSYGFWMGGSDRSVLIENEAAFNGLPEGFHNAPEPGFGHGGIVFVNGTSYHTKVIGNHCHDNNGGGIVLRGDLRSAGRAWKAHHWIIADNRLERNRWGLYAQHADWLFLSGNVSVDNLEADFLDDVTNLEQPASEADVQPQAVLMAPSRVTVGDAVLLDASQSVGPPQHFWWDIAGVRAEGPKVLYRFTRVGFHRVGLTVSTGNRADLAWADIYVLPRGEQAATEGNAAAWSARIVPTEEGSMTDMARSSVTIFDDASVSLIGDSSVAVRAEGHGGNAVDVIVPVSLIGLSQSSQVLSLWVKWRNEDVFNFRGPTPVVSLEMPAGRITLTPASARNLVSDVDGASEARWGWVLLRVALEGDETWQRAVEGELGPPIAVSFRFMPSGPGPFTVWMDGLTVE